MCSSTVEQPNGKVAGSNPATYRSRVGNPAIYFEQFNALFNWRGCVDTACRARDVTGRRNPKWEEEADEAHYSVCEA